MSQHCYGLHHQQKPIDEQEKDLNGSRVNVVLLELIKGEVAKQNQPGNVDEEEYKDRGVAKTQ